MFLSAVLQVSTVIVAVLTLVWHQTRTVDRLRKEVRADHNHLLKLYRKATRQARKDNDKLRSEFTASHDKLRSEFTASHDKLRSEFTASHGKLRSEFTASHGKLETSYGKLWDAVIANSRKLDRIEGFLGIGMPPHVADRAPGAAFGGSVARESVPPAREDPPDGPEPAEHEGEAGADTDG